MVLGVVIELYCWLAFQILTLTYFILAPFRPFSSCYGKQGCEVPVLLVHGYMGNPATFWPLIARLRRDGIRNVHAVTLVPFWGSARRFAEKVSDAVDQIIAKTGHEEVDIIGHSLGGLAAAYYLKSLGGKQKVRKFIALAAPFDGTYIAYLSPIGSTFDMLPGSSLTKQLDFRARDLPQVEVHTFRAGLDEYIIPHRSAFVGTKNRDHKFRWTGHAALLFSEQVSRKILEVLTP